MPTSDADKLRAALVGTWEHVSADIPKGVRRLKFITPTHYSWVQYAEDGAVQYTAGGTWALVDGKFAEKCEFASRGVERLRGKEMSFTAEVKDGIWHHSGTLATGFQVDEKWQRVPAGK